MTYKGPPIRVGWKDTQPLPYDDDDGMSEEEYEERGEQTCDECGTEVELLYEGMVVCEECGKHFPERG